MTCIEKLRELHPDWDDEEIEYYVEKRCVAKELIMPRPSYCGAYIWEKSDKAVCERCWNREIPEIMDDFKHETLFYLTGEELRLLNKLTKYLDCTREEAVVEGLRLLEIGSGIYVDHEIDKLINGVKSDGKDF